MASLQQSGDPYANHDSLIIGVVTVCSILSVSALLMRLASKRIKRVALDWDDYLAIVAWVITLAQSIVVAYGTQFSGLGRHALTLPTEKVTAFLKAYYALSFLQTTALATAKLSALCLLHRIFVTRGFRITIQILGIIVILWWTSFTFADAFICSPIRANWEPEIPQHCGDRRVLLLLAPLPWVLTDFAILIAPLFVIKNLHIRRSDRIGLCALFLTGGLTCIIACYRVRTLFIPVKDPTWDSVEIGLWSIIETNVTVFCVCVITIRPVLQQLFPSTIILKTRLGWSKLWSSRFHGSSNNGYSNESRSNSATAPYNSFTRLHEGIQRAAGFNDDRKQGKQMTGEDRSISLRTIKTGSHSHSSDEMV